MSRTRPSTREQFPAAETYLRAEMTPLDFLERAAVVHADRVAVVDGDRSFTFAQWHQRIRRFARLLQDLGVERFDRVAFLSVNREELLGAHFAVPMAGGVLVALNTRLKAVEIANLVAHSGSSILFVDPSLESSALDVDPSVKVVVMNEALERSIEAVMGAPVPVVDLSEDDPISINYTSGTTGAPKGVVYTHRSATLAAVNMTLQVNLTQQSRYLWLLPMFHCNGWCFPWALVAAGARSICVPSANPQGAWASIHSEGITHYAAAPTVHTSLLTSPSVGPAPNPIIGLTGGAAPSPSLVQRLRDNGIELRHVYGLTETYGPFTSNAIDFEVASTPEERAKLLVRQGHPMVMSGEVRVVDLEMADVPADGETLGEVVMRGNCVMAGYFQDPESTAKSFGGGWFHSGDLAVQHPTGEIEIRDRSKDIIISGGENISSIEVEQTLLGHPAVAACAVIGVPDEQWGEVGKAFVQFGYGLEASADDLREHCRGLLAHFKCPKHFEFGPIPTNSTGKAEKARLRSEERQKLQL